MHFNPFPNSMYKIEVFIPKAIFENLQSILLEIDAGHIGNYRGCLSYYPVTGIWFSDTGSNPYKGEVGKWSQEPELKVEFNVRDELKDLTVQKIKEVGFYFSSLQNHSNII